MFFYAQTAQMLHFASTHLKNKNKTTRFHKPTVAGRSYKVCWKVNTEQPHDSVLSARQAWEHFEILPESWEVAQGEQRGLRVMDGYKSNWHRQDLFYITYLNLITLVLSLLLFF